MSPEIILYELVAEEQPPSTVDALVTAVRGNRSRTVWVVLSHDARGNGSAIEQQLHAIREIDSRTDFEGPIRVIKLAFTNGYVPRKRNRSPRATKPLYRTSARSEATLAPDASKGYTSRIS